MTKEEAIENIKLIRFNAAITNANSFKEALDIAIEALSQPSLPRNLDEAANNYGVDIRLGYPRVMDETDRYIYNAFKAGAEWMAGQGVSIDGKVIMDFSNPADIINRRLIAKVGDALLEIEPGDVVVQIRKK